MSKYAVVIGINDYIPPEENGLKRLGGAIDDAERIYNWLIEYGDVLEKNCELILSTENPRNPIKNIVDKAVAAIVKKVVENGKDADRLYFYFAGHGIGVDRDAENNGLCMADWTDYDADTCSISTRAYRQKFISEGLFKEVVIWLDCCRDTKTSFTPEGAPRIQMLGENNAPRWFMGYATQYQKESFEAEHPDGDSRGVFTSALLDALSGAAAANGQSPVNADELRNHLYRNVPRLAQAAGYSQTPDVSHNTFPDNYLMFP